MTSKYSHLKILVLGARERHALVIVRSLSKLGCQVFTADSLSFSTASLSRGSRGNFLYADAELYPTKFIDDLEAILKKTKFDFVFAVSDLLPILLCKNQARLGSLSRFAITPEEIFNNANSKDETFKIAESIGLPAPRTRVLEREDDIEAALKDLEFPLVLKPASKTHVATKGDSVKAMYAHSKPELVEMFSRFKNSGRKFLLQEYIPGLGGEGVAALFSKGEARAVFSYKRVHEYPITGGASTLRESTWDTDLIDKARKILTALKWDGVAMVEFKRDLRSGEARLIEVNGRYWGSLALAVESGVDFPALHLRQMLGENVSQTEPYKVGCQVRWFLPGDLMYLMQKLSTKGPKFLREYLRRPFVKDDVWSWSDPLPILGEIRIAFFYLLQVLSGKRSITGEFRA